MHEKSPQDKACCKIPAHVKFWNPFERQLFAVRWINRTKKYG